MARSIIVAILLVVSVSAQTKDPAEALRTCVADNTSGKDRKDLAKWIFFAIAAHPEIKQMTSDNAAAAADQSSRTMAALVSRLLTDNCANETRAVAKTGQQTQAIQAAFQGLGQLAMQELMSDKSVQESMAQFQRYFDAKKLTEVLAVK